MTDRKLMPARTRFVLTTIQEVLGAFLRTSYTPRSRASFWALRVDCIPAMEVEGLVFLLTCDQRT